MGTGAVLILNLWSYPMQWFSKRKAGSGAPSRIAALFLLLAVVAVGCGGARDDRDEIRAANGEPDHVQYSEGPFSDYEVWTYYNYKGTGKDMEYHFQRNRNACGASKNWLLVMEREVSPEQGVSLSSPGQVPGNSRSPNPIRP